MKKYILPVFVCFAFLFVLLLAQQAVPEVAAKGDDAGIKQDGPLAVTSTPTPVAGATATPTAVPGVTAVPTIAPHPQLACLRINFEVSGDVAQAGTYEVQELNGRPLVSWTAQAGWQDSGWIRNLEISFDAVYVQVIFHPADGSPDVTMAIYNPAPGTEYGWVARGMCHAVEVGWP